VRGRAESGAGGARARRRRGALLLLALAACGCGDGAGGAAADSAETGRNSAATTADTAGMPAGTPVQVDTVRVDTLAVTLSAPGRTDVLRYETVRAPFAGTLSSLRVTDGDRVGDGALLGTIVSRSSEAALEGARAMLASARTAEDSADARRALELARSSAVERELRAPAAGVVLSHSAGPGDRVAEGDEILRLAAAGSSVFVADVTQSKISAVRPGQPVRIEMPAVGRTLDGVVRSLLPAAGGQTYSAPVRIDFRMLPGVPSVGLFGTAEITVDRREGVLSVPETAVLTDDVSGVSRVAVATPDGKARWIDVTPGVRDGGRVEVSGPGLAAGDVVIVSGQVGLPGGAPVVVSP